MTPALPETAILHIEPEPRQKQVNAHISLSLLLIVVSVLCTGCTSSTRSTTQQDNHASSNTSLHTGADDETDADTNTDAGPIKNLPVINLDQLDPLAQMIEQIDAERVVLVGEIHTRLDHHMVQLEVLKQLYQKNPNLAVGVEWFQQPDQPYLDAYIAGELSEREMLGRTDYYNHWRYDYRLYRPILQYARTQGIPVIALNAPKELTRALSKSGFDDLSAELKAQLPQHYDWSDREYEKRLRNVFDQHPDYPGSFENFLRVQLTWDESMAERAVRYLEDNPESRLVVFAGNGHIVYGSGIPDRIERRIAIKPVSILVYDNYQVVSKELADYLVLSTEQPLEPIGLIGALLDTEGKLLVIKGFSDNSAAKDAGLKIGTVIIGVDDTDVSGFTDFKLAVMEKKPGDSIELHYLENADAGKKQRKSVRLELR